MAHLQYMTVSQVINWFWHGQAHNLNSGASDRIEVPMNIWDVIGDGGINVIANRLRNMIEAPVTAVEDIGRGVIQIAPSRYLQGHDTIITGAKKPKVKGAKDDKVARPPNAFILYRQHHHPIVKAAHPKLHNNQISVVLGTQWKNETESTKSLYINLAQKLKVKHFIEHPDYQYQPRKPSEKKRRMSRRKAAALAESEQGQSSSSASATSPGGNFSSATPDLHKTVSGNAVLDLGYEPMDDETFAAMLEQYNESVPSVNTQAIGYIAKPVVFYDEPSEEAQTDANFYSSVLDYNPFAGKAELTEGMQNMMASEESIKAVAAALSPSAQQAAFDEQNESFFNAELGRDPEHGLGDWCTVFAEDEEAEK